VANSARRGPGLWCATNVGHIVPRFLATSCTADHRALAGGFDDGLSNNVHAVYFQNSTGLAQQPNNHPEVGRSVPLDGVHGFGGDAATHGQRETERPWVIVQEKFQLVGRERPIRVDEADARIELRLAGKSLLEPGHTDQNHGDAAFCRTSRGPPPGS